MPELSKRQREVLLAPINPRRVLELQGQSHLPAYDVEAHLTRMFGFEGWDREIVALWLISEDSVEKGGRVGWTVTYGCRLRLVVRNAAGEVVKVTDGCATGSAHNLPSRGDAHDFAMKNADSYALKRAAKAWGDQFGLSLYNKGQTSALVKKVAAYEQDPAAIVYEQPLTLGNDERCEDPPGLASDEVRMVDQLTRTRLYATAGTAGVKRDEAHAEMSRVTGRTITSANELTMDEAMACITEWASWPVAQ